jgi:hypothetical protein
MRVALRGMVGLALALPLLFGVSTAALGQQDDHPHCYYDAAGVQICNSDMHPDQHRTHDR